MIILFHRVKGEKKMEKIALKKLLRNIRENDYVVPEGINPFDLSLEMMKYIGDTDSELRDLLIYSILFHWMTGDKGDVLTLEEDHQLLKIAIDDNHLFYGLGNTGDSVFTRTFSVLIIAVAIYKHRTNSYLSKEEVDNILDKVLKFYDEDKDVRGYIEGKEWAHGAAHGADALDELARCKEIGYEGLKRILDSIYRKTNINYYSYIHQEDERMVTATLAAFERKLISDEEIIEWIRSFKDVKYQNKYPEDMTLRVNGKNFLRSLYFRLAKTSEFEAYVKVIKEVLDETSRF